MKVKKIFTITTDIEESFFECYGRQYADKKLTWSLKELKKLDDETLAVRIKMWWGMGENLRNENDRRIKNAQRPQAMVR